MKKNVFKNAIVGFLGQFLILLLGLIVPRIIIENYGSDTNGVLSTITQIFTYMALLEAGIGQAAKNLLYKPFRENNKMEISKIYSISQRYFRNVTIIYFLCVVISSFLIPFVIKSDLDFNTISLICFFQGAGGALSFYFIQTKTVILDVAGKSYINNFIKLLNQVFSYLAKIILAIFGFSIVFIQFIYFVITIIKVIFYQLYFKRKYSWIESNKIRSNEKLKDRNSFIITEIAWTIFSSTDMIVLSMFISSKMSSVYSVYNMVFISLNTLLNAVYSSINYILGLTYHENIERYKKIHDDFNSVFIAAIIILMTCSFVLIIPFVKLYTNGISDINYIYKSLPILFCLVQILSWSRYVSGNLVCVAGYAKKAIPINLLEALINVVLSIILVNKMGITGVLIATVLALPIKLIYCTYMSDKIILKRSCLNTIKILSINYLIFFIFVCIFSKIELNIENYFNFGITGGIIFIIVSVVTIFANLIVNRDLFNFIKKTFFKKEK